MEYLEKVVNQYLRMNTSYATMITGDWGTGKTYFFNTTLKNQIENTETIYDASKKYKAVRISLFGIKSIDDVQTQILLSLYPILKDSKFKLGSSIAKSFTKGLLHLKGLGDYTKYVDEITVSSRNIVNFNELVFCFDDFERISNDLSFEEVIGYINSLVELENIKIIILANENKIKETNYATLKEKIICNTIEFIPNIKECILSIVKNKYNSQKVYSEFLINNIDFVIEITDNYKNLRTIIFVFDYFHNIFSEIEMQFNSNVLLEKKNEILLYLFRLTFALSIEYKEGNITYKKRRELDKKNFRSAFWNKQEKVEVEESFRNKFEKKYFNNVNYTFHESIYTYITGANIFDYKLLFEELQETYHIVNNEIPPHYIVYNQLIGINVYNLTDKEYIQLTKKLVDFAFKGLYKINDFLTIFYLISRYNNPLNLNLENLTKKLKKAIDLSLTDYIPSDILQLHLNINNEAENKNHLNELRKYIIKKNYELKDKIEADETENIINLFYDNIEGFINKFITEEKYLFLPIFNKFNPNRVYSFYEKSSNQIKFKLIQFLQYRYNSMYGNEIKIDYDFFCKINGIVKKKISNHTKAGLTFDLLNQFENVTDEIRKKLS
ncbi:P-loop NTPase fold protein [Chryseobacterium takakiae]|uniref:P-loop NTPase fold protein n=1 Tax=Chryseobacterium takakiae TaxID=1302685 RepID=UPI000932F30C|nr:P-loop NTPase fold protein [Chryseobacterium takakiae]